MPARDRNSVSQTEGKNSEYAKAFCWTEDRTKVFAPLQHSAKPFACLESSLQWPSLSSQQWRWWEERIAVSFCTWGLLVLHLCFGQSAFLPPAVLTGHVQDSRFYPVSTSEIRSTVNICRFQPAIMGLSLWLSCVLCVEAPCSIKTSKGNSVSQLFDGMIQKKTTTHKHTHTHTFVSLHHHHTPLSKTFREMEANLCLGNLCSSSAVYHLGRSVCARRGKNTLFCLGWEFTSQTTGSKNCNSMHMRSIKTEKWVQE